MTASPIEIVLTSDTFLLPPVKNGLLRSCTHYWQYWERIQSKLLIFRINAMDFIASMC